MYRLDFDPPAYLELKAIHDQGDGLVRHEIAAALDALDAQLRPAPNDVGESRDGDVRILIVSPFRFLYSVDEEKKTVTILSVWQFRGR